jgi:hypothetical protein
MTERRATGPPWPRASSGMPEKLHYGYEGVERNFDEALRLYRQAAELGCRFDPQLSLLEAVMILVSVVGSLFGMA